MVDSTAYTADAPALPVKALPAKPTQEPSDDFFARLIYYYELEWGTTGPPPDPKAPPSRRDYVPPAPLSSPPMPFTEWPYGGTTSLGVTRPSSVDSPLMYALAPTDAGKWLNDHHIQIYGWVEAGANLSTNTVTPGGNAPAAYMYTPNTVQLDQAVMFIERLPDTVQKDHVDWGFRISSMYGVDYRYTTALGFFSDQLLRRNQVYGFDAPNIYGEVFFPQAAEGLMVRFGRFSALPDIESPFATSNYMYSHSMLNTFDNYTNTGVQTTVATSKNLFLQLGLTDGTETMPWNVGARRSNPDPNPLYPGPTMPVDPGAQPSINACARYQTDSAKDAIYLCVEGINNGVWGYNNPQMYALTYYHKFNDEWHLAFETYSIHQDHVANINNSIAAAAIANGGTPFSPRYMPFNAPFPAQCDNQNALTCTASAFAAVAYLNYKFKPLDNITFRAEYYDDMEGQRTGVKTRYVEVGLGWQHWFSPQVELRPEIAYYQALDRPAFNGNFNASIPPDRRDMLMAAVDLIWHY